MILWFAFASMDSHFAFASMGSHFRAHISNRRMQNEPKHANVTKVGKCSHSQTNRSTFASTWFTFQLLYGCVRAKIRVRGSWLGLGFLFLDPPNPSPSTPTISSCTNSRSKSEGSAKASRVPHSLQSERRLSDGSPLLGL